jgi:hypothetical protein
MQVSDGDEETEGLMAPRSDLARSSGADSPAAKPPHRKWLDVAGGGIVIAAMLVLVASAMYVATKEGSDPADRGDGALLANPLEELIARSAKRGAPPSVSYSAVSSSCPA